jgi:O-antigen biosynthesis protein
MNRVTFRETVKRKTPRQVTDLYRTVRDKAQGPPIETVVRRPLRFLPDPSNTPRLTLVLPTLHPKDAFGGVTTGISLFVNLGRELAHVGSTDFRVLAEEPAGESGWALLERMGAADLGITQSDVNSIGRRDAAVPTRAREVFLTFNWWTTLNTKDLVLRQSEHFRRRPSPVFYLIQDHEPDFYPFSPARLLATQALRDEPPVVGIYNSRELHDYAHARAEATGEAFVFQPTMPSGLRSHLDRVRASDKKQRILVYGRPSIPRNCFSLIAKGLELWSTQNPALSDWEVASVGTPHRPLKFPDGRIVRSLGKLSIDQYGGMLRTSSIGLSLMVSPHPSYPPLEMAHFGMRVITNRYANKDLSTSHPNILSLANPNPEAIADALRDACGQYSRNIETWVSAKTTRESYLETDPFSCLAELSARVGIELQL